MNQSNFDAFARRASDLLQRRSLLAGLGAALLTPGVLPFAADAKGKHHHKKGNKHKKRNKNKKICQNAKDCRQAFIPECSNFPEIPNCENQIKRCCAKACKSLGGALTCIDNIV
jgi:hypothetical protein